ncbi:MAG: tetratricopeptide repeat protein [Methylicorpusculum sp.]|uniref:tetratricopeptide repeat protein n=2 Tax=Methylicorpusculum sp. TaxID=2713644 RepID=UPI0027181374|nr:tetratricopeptide repeat protein [Methylicorpusculum sp.]MDO8938169.1 tetratricopeptide repeat protein [Methylicorpusculum sp.]MDP2177883.1 tetratricopeptide repeat protein [Methylicorpusculum sp.]MDP2200795.1 tetratricopeptide repeat protein [Methylicorpusculum sp.]MDP3529303.1 tetratricopeptide repeat protein [Methylicorpusculum sp.]
MLINKLLAVLMLVYLNGCSSLSEKNGTDLEAAVGGDGITPEVDASKTAIDPDVMYMLLAAEIAGQREQFDVALEGYLEAAKRVKDVRLAERAAKIALYTKNTEKAEEAVGLWLKQEPNNLTARKISLLAALRKEDKKMAVTDALEILEKDPEGFDGTLMELFKALGPKANAAFIYDVMEEVAIQQPDQASVYFVQSMLAMQLNSHVLAGQKIKKALDINPEWDKALLLEAQIAVVSNDVEKAKKLLAKLSKKDSENVKVRKLLAQLLIKSSDYEGAGQIYREIIDISPDDVESKFSLALVYLQLEQDDKASSVFKELVLIPEFQDQAGFYLGRIAVRAERNEEGLVWFDKVTSGPFSFDARIAAISLLIKQGEFDSASKRLDDLPKKTTEQKVRGILVRSELYNEQKRYEEAFQMLNDAIQEMPEQKELLYTRALVAERMGKLDILELDLKRILVNHPDDVSALNALGYTLADQTTRYVEAQQYLERALSLQPDEAVILDSYGWLQFKLNNLTKALEYLERAYALQPENEIAAHLIEVLWELGRKKEAIRLFDQAIKNAPDDEYLLDFKKRVLDVR